jgi:hypothetical protein
MLLLRPALTPRLCSWLPAGAVLLALPACCRLHAATHGLGSGKPLMLLIHGFPETWACWRHQLQVAAALPAGVPLRRDRLHSAVGMQPPAAPVARSPACLRLCSFAPS